MRKIKHPDIEHVVLLDEQHHSVGTAPKSTVHTTNTPLHLAFSCWVLRADGKTLLTRRALTKKTWPGVWTNSFCGHPAPGEPIKEAVTRRAAQELGMRIMQLHEILPTFTYRAVDASGIVEHELCPVWVAQAASEITPHPTEIAETTWVRPADLYTAAHAIPTIFSPWLVKEIHEPLLRRALGIQN